MKAKLYALHARRHREWRATLDSRLDAAFWFERYGKETRMVLFEPELSWGQAVWLSNKLTARTSGAQTTETIRGEIIEGLQTIRADAGLIRQFQTGEYTYEVSADNASIRSAAGAILPDKEQLRELCHLLEGRLLLPDEAAGLLAERLAVEWPGF